MDNPLIKYDALSVEAMDKIQICLDLLCEYGYIDRKQSLKETYESVVGIYKLERKDPKMWELVHNHKVQSLFQMEKQSGIQGIALTKPTSVDDLATLNSVIRLMAQEKGGEQPLNKYARFKNNINLWYDEMNSYGLTQQEQKLLEPILKISYGICESQERFMQLVQLPECGGMTLTWSDSLRKSIAKKNPAAYLELEKEFFKNMEEKNLSKNFCTYVWKVLIAMSRGYGFNLSHTLAYSLIALQEMNLSFRFPSIFWDCACLIVNSGGDGSEEGNNSKNYDKIAQALGKAIDSGIQVSPPDVNRSKFTFTPDPENNIIMYGLSGINKVGLDLVQDIIDKRPYVSLIDFVNRTALKSNQIISLIKSGAFHEFGSQERNMVEYIWATCDKKKRITLQNMPGLIRYGLIPDDEDLQRAKRIYEFNRYLKDNCKYDAETYRLDDRALAFMDRMGYDMTFTPEFGMNVKAWDKIYQSEMDVFRNWISANKEEILDTLNTTIFMNDWYNKANGTVSAWEMEAMCYYYHEHELAHINKMKYNISDYDQLPELPVVDKVFKRGGIEIPIFKLTRITGTVISRNKLKHTAYLLTTSGVVSVKFNKGHFLEFDKQVSVRNEETGKKSIIEKSWFTRGTKLVVQGFRRGDEFVAKNYKSSGGHTLYRIDEMLDNGDLVLRSERATGELEEGDDEA